MTDDGFIREDELEESILTAAITQLLEHDIIVSKNKISIGSDGPLYCVYNIMSDKMYKYDNMYSAIHHFLVLLGYSSC